MRKATRKAGGPPPSPAAPPSAPSLAASTSASKAAAMASSRRRVGEKLLQEEVATVLRSASSAGGGGGGESKGGVGKGGGLPFFVLVGGEAAESQGCERGRRELMHTSVNFIGEAYGLLRGCGVPRSQIITIAQVADYLQTLDAGARGTYRANGLPGRIYAEVAEQTRQKCAQLLAEGGCDYDGTDVNPATVWGVLLGSQQDPSGGGRRPVVPAEATSIFFAIYTHGDNHPSVAGDMSVLDPRKNEWYAHMPYPAPVSSRDEMYSFVATSEAKGFGKNRPFNYLYGSQLRAIAAQLFAAAPDRPVVGLLNYCLSGGNLEFLKNPVARKAYNADAWPLFLMSSSGAGIDSLVAGLWQAFFRTLAESIRGVGAAAGAASGAAGGAAREAEGGAAGGGGSGGGSRPVATLMDLYARVKRTYHEDNAYELINKIKDLAYPSIGAYADYDPFHSDLADVVTAGEGGLPDFAGLRAMQLDYKSGRSTRFGRKKVYIWDPINWGNEVDLCDRTRRALSEIAIPEEVHGSDGVAEASVKALFAPGAAASL